MANPTVTGLRIYPIKSFGGIELELSRVELRGLRFDRRWMLVDEEGRFMTQRTDTRLALFRTSVEAEGLLVTAPDGAQIAVPFLAGGVTRTVQIWKTTTEGIQVSDEIDDWFSSRLDVKCSLVHMPDSIVRATDPRYTQEGDMVGFADAFQVLVAGEASLDDLNQRLEEPLPMNRFRPNIIVTGTQPFEEDEWQAFDLNGIRFRAAKHCGRCSVTATNQETGDVGTEPLRTLAKFRLRDQNVYFGAYFVPEVCGEIALGNELSVRSTLSV